jgi:hypothetical protein
LPAVSVAFGIDPVAPGKIIVNEIDRYIGSARLWEGRHGKREHRYCKKNFFHNRENGL